MGKARDGARTLAVPHGQPAHDRESIFGAAPPAWYVELKRWLWCCFFIVSYFAVGILFYSHVETKPCEEEGHRCDGAPVRREPWTAVDALYFSMVSMSTVGYGDLFPSTTASRVFTLFFIIYGIMVPFASLASLLATLMDRAGKYFKKALSPCFGRMPKHPLSPDLDEDEAQYQAPGAMKFWVTNMTMPLLLFTTWQLFCACVFITLQDLHFSVALYHCLVTATTVGYGDVVLSKDSRPFAVVHVGVSVALLGACIAEVPALLDIRSVQLRQAEILQRALDADMIKALDRDGNGVDKLEFCLGILIEIGAELGGLPLQWDDVIPFIQQFEAFDMDGSGHLSHQDLELMASAMELRGPQLRKQLSRQMSMKRMSQDSSHSEASSSACSETWRREVTLEKVEKRVEEDPEVESLNASKAAVF